MIIAIEGPEKAGKSTLAKYIAERESVEIRHWGPVYPDDRAYTNQLIVDSRSDKWYIWDRCWPSEHVYGKLLKRFRRLADNPWLGEWLHGRALQTSGIRVMLLPTDISNLTKNRDETDLPVDPREETILYTEYADRFGWTKFYNDYQEYALELAYKSIYRQMITVRIRGSRPPKFAGPLLSGVIFLGDKEDENDTDIVPGAWLPFTSTSSINIAKAIGDVALKCGWTYVGNMYPDYFGDRNIVACGERAWKYCDALLLGGIVDIANVLRIPALSKLNDEQSNEFHKTVSVIQHFCKGELENE